jgi:hypothetical protein
MIKQIDGPHKYGDERRLIRFAWRSTHVAKESDGSRYRIWLANYEVLQQYSIIQGWRDYKYFLLPESLQ